MQALTKACRFIGVHALQAKIGEELKESSTNYTLMGCYYQSVFSYGRSRERRAYEVPQSTVSEQDTLPMYLSRFLSLRQLCSRNLNVTEALKMLLDTLKWREEFNIEAALKEEYPTDVFGNLGHIFGRDKLNHPVTYVLYCSMFSVDEPRNDLSCSVFFFQI